MAMRNYNEADMITIRNKRSSQKYPAYTSDPTSIHGKTSSHVSYFHYVDGSHMQPCHYLIAESYGRPRDMTVNNKTLAVSTACYTKNLEVGLRIIPDFNAHLAQRKVEWALSGECAERYHYSSMDKDIVCRCNGRKHRDYKPVKNQRIRELCVQFFQHNSTKTTCTRKQWRIVEDKFPESSMTSSIQEKTSTKEARRASIPNRSFLQYNSTPRTGSLDYIDGHPPNSNDHWSCPSLCPHTYCLVDNLEPRDDTNCYNSGSARVSGVSKNVWHICCPSAYFERHRMESVISIPLDCSLILVSQGQSSNIERHQDKLPAVSRVQEVPQNGFSCTGWYNDTNNSSSSQFGSVVQNLTDACMEHSRSQKDCLHSSIHEISGLEVARHTTSRLLATYESSYRSPIAYAVYGHSPQIAAELDSTPTHS